MNLRLYIICIAAVLALVVPAVADNSTATVHGGVYGWDTFEPLENAVVDVNSTPAQSMVAKYGMYSFELGPGNYTITAKYYQNNTTTYSATGTITIIGGGRYVLDLLLLPVYSEELMEGSEANVSSRNSTFSAKNQVTEVAIDKTNNSNSVNIPEQTGIYSSTVSYLLIAFMICLLLAAGYRSSKKHKKVENTPPKVKIGHMTGDYIKLENVPELSIKAQDKNIDLGVRQDFQVNTEETASVIKPVIESGSESGIPVIKPETEPESKIPSTKPVIESESKIPITERAKPESGISEKKSPAENKEEYPAQETELEEFVQDEEEHDNPLEELADNPEIEIPAPKKKLPLPADLQEVMGIIRGHGGRITQKDLRSRLKYSEGKVSLMLADLERRGLVEKFKRGRGNIIILKDEDS